MKKLVAILLCCCAALCLSGCEKSGSGGNNTANSTKSTPAVKTVKKFSSEDELKEYAYGFWVCNDNNASINHYKIMILTDAIVFNCDFSYTSNETLSDCLEKVLKLDENQGEDFKNDVNLLLSGLNVDGMESSQIDIQYDAANSRINDLDGQDIGKFLSDGTFECDNGDIYIQDNNLKDVGSAFIKAKGSIFIDKYEGLASDKDVKYNPWSYLGKKFLLTGTAELDDYYNYDYRDLESLYFCICVTPQGGGYSDRWYIYCERYKYSDLFETLKKRSLNMVLICSSYYPDSLEHEMANLVDYCY